MNNKKICNPKTEVPSGTSLNDKDYLNSALSLLKDMVSMIICLLILRIFKEMYLNLLLKRDGIL